MKCTALYLEHVNIVSRIDGSPVCIKVTNLNPLPYQKTVLITFLEMS
jgi:hypothetical protein